MLLHREGKRLRSAAAMSRKLRSWSPDVTYLVDLAVAPLAAWLLAGRPGKLVVDTGDAPKDFLKLVSRSRMKHLAAALLERIGYGSAAQVVVRGPFHAEALAGHYSAPIEVVPDGVDLDVFTSRSGTELRQQLGLSDAFVVGVQGNFTWYPALGGGLGWDAVSALQHLADLPVHVVLIGEGPGILELRQLASDAGMPDRLHALGRVSFLLLPDYLALCDVLILTQTNDPSSWVRTTGKLPGYLAVGRPVLASAVGTATQILPESMLLHYDGYWDAAYPQRLAARLRQLYGDPTRIEQGAALRQVAKQFDYREVAARAADITLRLATT
jgi:glycosyltransferase involved in cell wall biosynthesis